MRVGGSAGLQSLLKSLSLASLQPLCPLSAIQWREAFVCRGLVAETEIEKKLIYRYRKIFRKTKAAAQAEVAPIALGQNSSSWKMLKAS